MFEQNIKRYRKWLKNKYLKLTGISYLSILMGNYLNVLGVTVFVLGVTET